MKSTLKRKIRELGFTKKEYMLAREIDKMIVGITRDWCKHNKITYCEPDSKDIQPVETFILFKSEAELNGVTASDVAYMLVNKLAYMFNELELFNTNLLEISQPEVSVIKLNGSDRRFDAVLDEMGISYDEGYKCFVLKVFTNLEKKSEEMMNHEV